MPFVPRKILGQNLSLCDKLILSLARRQVWGEFSASDLVVMAWEDFPKDFGMRGYKHPDSNRVYPKISLLLQRGWFIARSDRTYVLANQVAALAKAFVAPDIVTSVPSVTP